MIDFDISIIIIGLILLSILCIYLKFVMKKENVFLLFFSIFYFYLLISIKYTLFPIPITMAKIFKNETTFLSGVNLIPFNFKSINYLLSKQVIYNILLSIPFGFGISYITKLNRKKLVILAISFGTIIESLQLTISLFLEYTYRFIDINDIIFNFIGVIIGFYLFKNFSILVVKALNRVDLKIDLKSDTILSYIYKISKENI
ncbi:VanZ family protein [Caloranaerobacter sp. DY30410]|uniref:VanZ family protein n=1 Tax=Caloranaerobacter sp. DY30410 TaxID=3238305 RepID=UPI003CFC708E